MAPLPTGTVTFLFTDIEDSTRLVEYLGSRYAEVLAEYRQLLRTVFQERGGFEVDTQGDSLFVTFPRAKDAFLAAIAAQQAIFAHPWPEGVAVRVRMGLHTGAPLSVETGYVGVDVHRAARIGAAGHGGQILLSEATHILIEEDLPPGASLRDLGEHRLKDLTRPVRLFQVIVAGLPADFPPLRLLSILPNNLPIQLTSFVGRDREMAEVKHLLATTRSLTLTGTGGCGKTRLALQMAADLLDEFPDGVWLVELAALSDATLITRTVASALHVQEEPGRPLVVTLSESLRTKRLLLVLDNCEHLIAACAHLAETLLLTSPTLKLLATSRERLGIPGEMTYSVPSLPVPDLRRPASIEQLTQVDSVRLFVERAVSSQPEFRVIDTNALAVARICHALEGIPLAIELAAARVKVLSAQQIAKRLDDRFRLLTEGSRTVSPRQQTLQATMDWSYELLSEPERILLRRLSVFAGGFSLEAVETICSGDSVEVRQALDLLTYLVDKSLVMVDYQGEGARYRLLETVRQYGRDRLLASRQAEEVRAKHRDWYVELAEQAEPMLAGPDEAWLDRLDKEQDNLRAAIDFSLRSGQAEAALRLGAALWPFWQVRGYWTEGRQWLEAALDGSRGAPPALRAKAIRGAGELAQYQGDHERAQTLSEESLALFRALGDKHGMARALSTLGNVAYHQGDYTAAGELHEESLVYGRELGDAPLVATSLVNLASIADHHGDFDRASALCRESLTMFRHARDKRGAAFALNMLGILASDQGNYPEARARFEESLALRRELGDKRGIAASLDNLGLVAWEQRDYEAARALYEESLTLRRELGDKHGIAASLDHMGLAAWHQGDYRQATALLEESLTVRKALGDKAGIAGSLEGLARVAQDPERAARLCGAATTLRDAIDAPRPPAERSDYERRLNGLRTQLGEVAFAAAWNQGRAMTVEEAIQYAITVAGV